ncbi:K02A2.6-like [Cordylochernes scorpioides]|uniref:RNA-directed DNA polymerase n=1 Tax=Cordylochernes scorpioides TaxID=51811 RepID=A0ABY6JZU8_9ARAC|nr:K02A2.6-like [Cordylochernes scorpioides]
MAHDFGKCPAYGKECYKCRQPNHFANCCKNRAIRCIQEIEEEKDNLLIIDSIMVGQVLRKPWKSLIYIQGHPVDIKLDTGADVNILPESLIKEWPNMPLLETADCKIYTYTGQQIPVVGKCLLDCKTKYACRKVTFLIVNNSAVPILGLDECVKLNLVKRVETISDISVTLTGLLDKYKDVFKGNGHLSYMYDIKISDKAESKICPARRLPRALLQPVKEELFKMEEDEIIEKIEEPTVLDLARESRLKLTLNKLQMATGEVKFLGHTISQEGILPDQDKVRAIQNMQIPKNKQELQRILGTITYLAKFIPDLSSNTSNMRNLLKKDIIWNWNIAADQELNFIKTLLTSPPVLRHFDPNEPLELFADASKDGFGAILMQKEKPLSYASASLTSPQKHYSQIEKELLALYFGCKRFHYFLYGRKFTAYTDHKPLVSLLKKNFDQMSPRLQRLSLYLLNYQFELKFIPGKSMIPADTLSRHFLPQEQMEDKELDLCSQTFVLNVEIKDQRLTRLQEDTLNDEECCLLKQYILTGWPLHKKNLPSNLKPYWEFKEELHEWQNLICRGNKLLIPKTQRSDILKILHASHQGINNTIALAKGFIYWPGMNKEIEELINNCSICQQTSRANLKEPLLPHQAPEYPWQKVGIDIFQIESSKYLLIVDYFSKYPEIYQLQDMTTDTIIRRLKRTFSNFGIPETLVSDNGPPFFSKEFQNFTRTWNIVHVTSSPYHAQSNRMMVERTVQTLKKLIKRCGEESTDPYLALLNLRNTPHNNLPSPAQILMSRKLRSIIPSKTSQFVPSMINNEAIQKQLVDNQVKMKNYYDRHTRPADPLSITDRVWFRKDNRWIPGQLKNQANEPRSFYVKDQEGNEYRRNRIHIREDKRSETTHTDWEKPLELNQEQADLQDLEETPSQPTSSGLLSSPGSPENVTTTGPPESCTNGSPGNLITTRSAIPRAYRTRSISQHSVTQTTTDSTAASNKQTTRKTRGTTLKKPTTAPITRKPGTKTRNADNRTKKKESQEEIHPKKKQRVSQKITKAPSPEPRESSSEASFDRAPSDISSQGFIDSGLHSKKDSLSSTSSLQSATGSAYLRQAMDRLNKTWGEPSQNLTVDQVFYMGDIISSNDETSKPRPSMEAVKTAISESSTSLQPPTSTCKPVSSHYFALPNCYVPLDKLNPKLFHGIAGSLPSQADHSDLDVTEDSETQSVYMHYSRTGEEENKIVILPKLLLQNSPHQDLTAKEEKETESCHSQSPDTVGNEDASEDEDCNSIALQTSFIYDEENMAEWTDLVEELENNPNETIAYLISNPQEDEELLMDAETQTDFDEVEDIDDGTYEKLLDGSLPFCLIPEGKVVPIESINLSLQPSTSPPAISGVLQTPFIQDSKDLPKAHQIANGTPFLEVKKSQFRKKRLFENKELSFKDSSTQTLPSMRIKSLLTWQWHADLAPKEMAASDMRNRRHVQPLITWSTNAAHPVYLD